MFKRYLSGLLAVLFLLSTGSAMAACSGVPLENGGDTTATTTASTEPATEPATQPAGDPETEPEKPTPKKYVTLRFDDGITQDDRVMEILRKYDMDCCTFYINTGLYGANWAWVGETLGKPDLTHQRYTKEELEAGKYEGFDVGSHTLQHNSLKNLNDRRVIREVKNDAENIAALTGKAPVGLAWPGGDTEYSVRNIETILANTDIRYGSCTTPTNTFDLPTYFMEWKPTCSFTYFDIDALTDQFIAAEPEEDMLFFVWCHSYELDAFDLWDEFDAFVKKLSEAAADDSIVPVTNSEFYEIFKEDIPAWKE